VLAPTSFDVEIAVLRKFLMTTLSCPKLKQYKNSAILTSIHLYSKLSQTKNPNTSSGTMYHSLLTVSFDQSLSLDFREAYKKKFNWLEELHRQPSDTVFRGVVSEL
jgi:hypothetical protein